MTKITLDEVNKIVDECNGPELPITAEWLREIGFVTNPEEYHSNWLWFNLSSPPCDDCLAFRYDGEPLWNLCGTCGEENDREANDYAEISLRRSPQTRSQVIALITALGGIVKLNSQANANARLIAAAPDLLAACQDAQTAIYDAMHAGNLSREYAGSVIEKIEAAIAKASRV